MKINSGFIIQTQSAVDGHSFPATFAVSGQVTLATVPHLLTDDQRERAIIIPYANARTVVIDGGGSILCQRGCAYLCSADGRKYYISKDGPHSATCSDFFHEIRIPVWKYPDVIVHVMRLAAETVFVGADSSAPSLILTRVRDNAPPISVLVSIQKHQNLQDICREVTNALAIPGLKLVSTEVDAGQDPSFSFETEGVSINGQGPSGEIHLPSLITKTCSLTLEPGLYRFASEGQTIQIEVKKDEKGIVNFHFKATSSQGKPVDLSVSMREIQAKLARASALQPKDTEKSNEASKKEFKKIMGEIQGELGRTWKSILAAMKCSHWKLISVVDDPSRFVVKVAFDGGKWAATREDTQVPLTIYEEIDVKRSILHLMPGAYSLMIGSLSLYLMVVDPYHPLESVGECFAYSLVVSTPYMTERTSHPAIEKGVDSEGGEKMDAEEGPSSRPIKDDNTLREISAQAIDRLYEVEHPLREGLRIISDRLDTLSCVPDGNNSLFDQDVQIISSWLHRLQRIVSLLNERRALTAYLHLVARYLLAVKEGEDFFWRTGMDEAFALLEKKEGVENILEEGKVRGKILVCLEKIERDLYKRRLFSEIPEIRLRLISARDKFDALLPPYLRKFSIFRHLLSLLDPIDEAWSKGDLEEAMGLFDQFWDQAHKHTPFPVIKRDFPQLNRDSLVPVEVVAIRSLWDRFYGLRKRFRRAVISEEGLMESVQTSEMGELL